MEQHKEITDLIYKYIRDELNEEETIRLQNWIKQSDQSRTFFEEVSNVPELIAAAYARAEGKKEIDIASAWQKMKALGWQLPAMEPQPPARVIPLSWRQYAAIAASLLLIALAGVYVLWLRPAKKTTAPTATLQPVTHDATPHTQHALLTLDDGRTIILDRVKSGSLATQGNIRVVKLANGQISYMGGAGSKPATILYNTVTVPRGSDVVHLQLGDGSKVSLNAASSIRYPVAFMGNERKVEITGEAYFEVLKEVTKPFIVMAQAMEVRVLGTHFNINAYRDNSQISTTLVEGSVKITPSIGGKAAILKPGEQAQLSDEGELQVVHEADVEKEIAWKNGLFIFNGDDIVTVMNELSRWYNVDVVYEGKAPDLQFYGVINRNQPASSVLKILQAKSTHFKIENGRIIVTP
jgi:transmembrane sensor